MARVPLHPGKAADAGRFSRLASEESCVRLLLSSRFLQSGCRRCECNGRYVGDRGGRGNSGSTGDRSIEQWNGANNFVLFARRGELASNRREDHEVSMLALHLLQNCMIYVNTLMLQHVLAHPDWRQKLQPRDLSALTPLIWEHVNPYGRFELDMNARIPLD